MHFILFSVGLLEKKDTEPKHIYRIYARKTRTRQKSYLTRTGTVNAHQRSGHHPPFPGLPRQTHIFYTATNGILDKMVPAVFLGTPQSHFSLLGLTHMNCGFYARRVEKFNTFHASRICIFHSVQHVQISDQCLANFQHF